MMPKTKKKTVTNDRGERQVSCWLPDDFMDEFDDYVARKMSIDLDRLVKELKLKMKDSELTIIDGKKVGYDKSVTSSYDLPKIIEYANEKVIPLTDITISRPQIDKAINKVTKIKEMEEDELIRLGDMKIIDSKTTFKYK